MKAVRDGMSKVIPVPLLSLFSAAQLQAMVCGSPEIPLALLKSVATYKGIEPTSALVAWFWEVMEEFSNQERSLFLRFVWGRTRLPRTIADFRGRDFVLQVLDKYNPPDHFLPESYTCFFLLKMPRYSCKVNCGWGFIVDVDLLLIAVEFVHWCRPFSSRSSSTPSTSARASTRTSTLALRWWNRSRRQSATTIVMLIRRSVRKCENVRSRWARAGLFPSAGDDGTHERCTYFMHYYTLYIHKLFMYIYIYFDRYS